MTWRKLLDIARQNAQEQETFIRNPPLACPNDGTPLDTGPNGELHCPFDGWVWDGYNHLT